MTRSSIVRAFILCAATLLIGSLIPIRIKVALHITSGHRLIHPFVHIAGFAAFTIFAALLAKSRSRALAAPVAAIFFGFVLELLEHLFYHQVLEISDVRLDGYGAAIGYLAYLTSVGVFRAKLNTISG